MSKKSMPYRQYLAYQSEFSRRFACWATNHRGWAKMKRTNKRRAKRRERQEMRKEVEEQ